MVHSHHWNQGKNELYSSYGHLQYKKPIQIYFEVYLGHKRQKKKNLKATDNFKNHINSKAGTPGWHNK